MPRPIPTHGRAGCPREVLPRAQVLAPPAVIEGFRAEPVVARV
ncbi:MAG: hypothetical protein QOG58_4587, partial [Caballeronia sp.]|nr:hypothetical protein [Caballeronia sp.]